MPVKIQAWKCERDWCPKIFPTELECVIHEQHDCSAELDRIEMSNKQILELRTKVPDKETSEGVHLSIKYYDGWPIYSNNDVPEDEFWVYEYPTMQRVKIGEY